MPENEITSKKDLIKSFRSYVNESDYLSGLLYAIPLIYKELISREVIQGDSNMSSYINRALLEDKHNGHRFEKYFAGLETEEFPSIIESLLNEGDSAFSLSNVSMMSSKEISTLVYKLLDMKDGDAFYDLGSGYGSLITHIYGLAKSENKNLFYIGRDIDSRAVDLSVMIFSSHTLGKVLFDLREGDATGDEFIPYSKAYTYPPIREHFFNREDRYISKLYPGLNMAGHFFEQWIYIDSMLHGLNDDSSRACALIYGRSLLNTNHNRYLLRLLHDGYIEGIIELPSFSASSGPKLFLLIFSKGNSAVKSLDCSSASFISSEMINGRKSEKINIDAIYEAYTNESSPYLTLINNEDLRDKINWYPSSLSYSVSSQNDRRYIPLCEVASVSSGLPHTLRDFTLASSESGDKILTSTDIVENGINWDELHSVILTKPVSEKYLLHKGDVVVTSKSTKVKVAVIDREPECNLILTGGMIKVVPDKDKLNPYYLKMYLDSQEGSKALESLSVGTVIIHLSPALLSGLKVPVIDISSQTSKAHRYQELVSRINERQKEINKLVDQITSLINKID